jgi:hypothetical protein
MPLILLWITQEIYNTILTTSMFSKSWKISKVIPIAKIKNPFSSGNYGPISILLSLSKSLEIQMKDQIYHSLSILAFWIAFNQVSTLLIVQLQHSSMLPMTFTKAVKSLTFRRPLTVLSKIFFVRNPPLL